jgi:hypothetical protein
MLTGLTAPVLELATWLQTASMVVPVSQLSLISWFMFAVSGAFRQGAVQRN